MTLRRTHHTERGRLSYNTPTPVAPLGVSMADVPDRARRKPISKRLSNRVARQEETRGLLIAFEGPDGAGKSTQRRLFKTWLESEGHEVVTTKWASSPLVKPLIKARKKAHALRPEEFCLLQAADFRYRLEHEILPALWQGKMVVADRFLFTGLTRDAARGLELDWLLHAYSPLFWPDIVFHFSVSLETSTRRVAATRTPKFYDAGQDVTSVADPLNSYKQFESRVIREYDNLALIFQFVTIDGEQPIYEQHQRIRRQFQEGRRRAWGEWNVEAVAEWLERNPQVLEVRRED
jgi:dTMP kinase